MDAVARDQLIENHYGLAVACATRFLDKLPPHASGVDREALRSAALEALVKCVDRWDDSRGVAFASFAWFRMWGAMRDELREADPVSRLVRQRSREIMAAGRQLLERLGRAPTDEELAEELGCDVVEIEAVRVQTRTAHYTTSLDEILPVSGMRKIDLVEGDAGDVAGQVCDEEFVATLLLGLPERERFVVTLYYFEQLTLREIGELLGVTESRASQLRKKALERMRVAAGVAA